MENLPRQKLSEIVKHAARIRHTTGRKVLTNPEDCRYILKKLCGSKHEREINVLITAQHGGVIKSLKSLPSGKPLAPYLEELTNQLVDRFALAKDAAQWALYAWAEALNVKVPHAVFHCTWKVEVLGHAASDLENHWKPLGRTPENVIIPPDYDIGLCPEKMNRERFPVWVRYLETRERIKYLDLSGQEIDNENLALLERFPNLEHLDISNTNINDNGLAHLEKTKGLKHLDLSQCCWISDKGMGALSSLNYLTTLDLSETRITNESLVHVSKLTYLKHLVLKKTSIKGAALTPLDRLHALIYLDLSHTAIEDAALAALCGCPNLETLWLDDCKGITDAGLAHLRPLKNLRKLGLSNTEIDDKGVEENLMQLGLRGIRLGRCWAITETLKDRLEKSGVKLLN